MRQIEKQKCDLCEKECWVLYPILFGRDNFLAPRRGVCRKCFDKAEELDNILLLKSKKVAESYIESAKSDLEFWENTLKEINQDKDKENKSQEQIDYENEIIEGKI